MSEDISPGKQKRWPDAMTPGLRFRIVVTPNGTRSASWTLRWRDRNPTNLSPSGQRRMRELSLGSYPDVSLSNARDLARDFHKQVKAGADPIAERKRLRQPSENNFGAVAELWVKRECGDWTDKHLSQVRNTLEQHAASLKPLDVARIGKADVVKVLAPIWIEKRETASRVRQRIEAVLDYAIAQEIRPEDRGNPARLTLIKQLLPKLPKAARKVKHLAAMPYGELPDFMADLKAQEGVSARALRFLIHTASRTSEVLGATWGEVDATSGLWVIPDSRMKADRLHEVPLTQASLDILRLMRDFPLPITSELIFPNDRNGLELSNAALPSVLKRMGRKKGVTVHGFRSAFRTWAADKTDHQRDTIEASMAHAPARSKTEAAYYRANLLEKRTALLAMWSAYLEGTECEA